MNIISDIPGNIKDILLKNGDFSNVVFIKSYGSNITPNPMTKIYVSIEVESINIKDLTSPQYLGSSNGSKYFGNYTDATIVLDIYSPRSIGGNVCYDTFFNICEAFSNDSTYVINNVCCEKIKYDDDIFCFKSSCKLNISLFIARQDSNISTFSDVCVIKE